MECNLFSEPYISLKQNKEQLEEMKRQWEEDHRPVISCDIISQSGMFLLRLRNIGKMDAYNVRININKEFYDCLLADSMRVFIDNFKEKSLTIEINAARYIMIANAPYSNPSFPITSEHFNSTQCKEWIEQNKNTPIVVSGTYNDKYSFSANLKLSDFPEYSLDFIDSEVKALTKINDNLIQINEVLLQLNQR